MISELPRVGYVGSLEGTRYIGQQELLFSTSVFSKKNPGYTVEFSSLSTGRVFFWKKKRCKNDAAAGPCNHVFGISHGFILPQPYHFHRPKAYPEETARGWWVSSPTSFAAGDRLQLGVRRLKNHGGQPTDCDVFFSYI